MINSNLASKSYIINVFVYIWRNQNLAKGFLLMNLDFRFLEIKIRWKISKTHLRDFFLLLFLEKKTRSRKGRLKFQEKTAKVLVGGTLARGLNWGDMQNQAFRVSFLGGEIQGFGVSRKGIENKKPKGPKIFKFEAMDRLIFRHVAL